MRNLFSDDWKILKTGKSSGFAIIIVITLLFLLVIAMNVHLIFNMTSNQTEEIGQMQLENIRVDFESKIIYSENATMQIASEAEILISNDNLQENLMEFFIKKKLEQKKLLNGVCFNVYIANKD